VRAVLFPDSRDSALRLARSYGSTVLIDLDGTLVPTGDVSAGAASRVKALLREFSEAGVDVLIITNRRDEVPDIPARVVTNARKPWTPRSRLGSPSCVLGDQIATDGALAFRLNIPFIKVPLTTDCRPWPSRYLDRALSRAVRWGRKA
jgi:predicted HAD superfamily phosphohydrolase YqeG